MLNKEAEKKLDRELVINIGVYIIAAGAAVILKLYYSNAANSELLIFLKPVSKLVELFYGISFQFESDIGFYNLQNGISIEKSCAGVNFFIIFFCMLAFSLTSFFNGLKSKLTAIALFFVSSYVIAILVNSFRITASILLLDTGFASGLVDKSEVHRIAGILFYFFFLILGYIGSKRIIEKVRRQNEAS